MILAIGMVLLGVFLLYWGAEWLVSGTARFAVIAGVSSLLSGILIIGFGTSMPELVASLVALYRGNGGDIALGNVLGSNIANIGLVTGIAAIICPLEISERTKKREMPIMLVVTLLLAMVVFQGAVGRWSSLLLLLALVAYLLFQYFFGLSTNDDFIGSIEEELVNNQVETTKEIAFDCIRVAAGTIFLLLGGYCLVYGAVCIAHNYEVSERVIGLSMVALGTSCPELATAIVAAWKKHTQLIIGNIIGSNIFNVLAIVGISSMVFPFSFSRDLLFIDTLIMLGFTLAIALLMKCKGVISRLDGVLFLLAYSIYFYFLFAA
jgi:cation:H+ antiporter